MADCTNGMKMILLLFLMLTFPIASKGKEVENDFETVFPTKLHDGRFRRDTSTHEAGSHQNYVTFGIKTKTDHLLLDLKRNVDFHTSKILLRTFNSKDQPITEQHSPDSCFYYGSIRGNQHSNVLMSTCNGLRGVIEDDKNTLYIEPLEGHEDDKAHKLYVAPDDDEVLMKDGRKACGISSADEDLDSEAVPSTTAKETKEVSHSRSRRSLIDVEQPYVKYLTTNKTRYAEMFIVVDHKIYRKYNNDSKLVTNRMLNNIHAVDRSYSAINIRLVIVGIEIWTNGDRMARQVTGGGEIGAFTTYWRNNIKKLLTHDVSHFMSHKGWSGGVAGMAWVGSVCSGSIPTAVDAWSFTSITGPHVILGHELGHNFNFPHDADMVNCTCLTPRGCFMGGHKTRRPGFTDCNMRRLAAKPFSCIDNYPKGPIAKVCGNGIVERGEECDCGTPEMCLKNDPCCQPHECKLKAGSQCSDLTGPDCCKSCLFKKQGTLCREAKTSCDFAEYCTGKTEQCPADKNIMDSTPCSDKLKIIEGATNYNSVFLRKLSSKIKARHLRINPQYKRPNGQYYCMRLEIRVGDASEDVASVPTPISTPDLYYTSAVCLAPKISSCSDTKDVPLMFIKTKYQDCDHPHMRFVIGVDGTLKHHCTGKYVCPVNNQLYIKSKCDSEEAKFERLGNFGLKHQKSGLCVEAANGWPSDGQTVRLRGTRDCNGGSHRTELYFLIPDDLLPVGLENNKFPSASIKSSSVYKRHPANEVRLNGKGWCLPKTAGRKEYIQFDLGEVKTVGALEVRGIWYDWVTGFKLYYSDDAVHWKGYEESGHKNGSNSFCYNGKCTPSLTNQCKDLWDSGATKADDKCWSKLNKEAEGFGTCNPVSNTSCPTEDVLCGQIQCHSSKNSPDNIKYGSKYTNIDINGTKCSAASITIPKSPPSDETGNGLGMVTEGTKCGAGKICKNYKCISVSTLTIKRCLKQNGSDCFGRGQCDSQGKCHCDSGYDPTTNCKKAHQPRDGEWGQWLAWSRCTVGCNGGKRHKYRFCNAPFPAHGGKDCSGIRYEEEKCNTVTCPVGRSCRDILNIAKAKGMVLYDGIYQIQLDASTSLTAFTPVFCDMTRDGGGWTLIVSSHTNDWTADNVKVRNAGLPSLSKDYSILKYADKIKESYLIKEARFQYRLEAQERGRWGGIWKASNTFSFVSTTPNDNVDLLKKFDTWNYSWRGIQQRMPYIYKNMLTMSSDPSRHHWGTITDSLKNYHPAPWISAGLMEGSPEHIWYWLREGDYEIPRSCREIKLRGFQNNKIYSDGVYQIQSLNGGIVKTNCDMSSLGGGWTLLVKGGSKQGWTRKNIEFRNENDPSGSTDYSIFGLVNKIKMTDPGEDTFQYMIEADGKRKWGGVFSAPTSANLLTCPPKELLPTLLKKFDNWDESMNNLAKRLPYVTDINGILLTTSGTSSSDTSGVLVQQGTSGTYLNERPNPSSIKIWIREGTSHRSCNEIKTKGQQKGYSKYKNGYFTIKTANATILPVYCDMTSDDGGFTLLVTSRHGNWSGRQQVLSRNENTPSTDNDYSILRLANAIRDLSVNTSVKYKLDGNKMNRWGGIFEVPREYSFTHTSNNQRQVKVLKQFDKWDLNVWWKSINNRMPWLGNPSKNKGLLTTAGSEHSNWWGTIISGNMDYKPAPWIYPSMQNPGVIWYWINEDDCSRDRNPVDGKMSPWSLWSQCSSLCGAGKQVRFRQCTAPTPRCGGKACDSSLKANEERSCTGHCPVSPIKDYNDQYCVLPKSGECNVIDNTQLVWRSGLEMCNRSEAQFIFNVESGLLIHKCSGKPVCPKDGVSGWGTDVVVSSKCPEPSGGKHFMRTHRSSLHYNNKCVHPMYGSIANNRKLNLWAGCFDDNKLTMNFYKLDKGQVKTSMWDKINITIPGLEALTKDVRFPNNPSTEGFLDNFDSPYDVGSNYGLRLQTYFVAPETGYYVFMAACDDMCAVYLHVPGESKKKIIDVKSWTSRYQWTKYTSQKSERIWLNVGSKSLMIAELVEQGGGDHVSVGVALPSGKQLKPIPASYLSSKA